MLSRFSLTAAAQSALAFRTQFPHKRGGAVGQFRMVFAPPGRPFSFKESEQFAAADFGPGSFDKKSTASARTYQ